MTDNEWQPKEDFEKHGTQVIAWLYSDKGFQDMTVRLLYIDLEKGPAYQELYSVTGWYWGDSEEPVKRPDLINGVVPWPEPGEK